MYKVMIVDDETIILSGIKFLLDWQKHDCVISATARNGKDALEQIRQSPPDIVLADINMPVMDGISLLKTVNEEFPYITFIMLTNLEEFELARQCLVNRAIDYLLKSRLEPAALEQALEAAKKEREARGRLMVVDSQDYFIQQEREELINRALQNVLFMQSEDTLEQAGDVLASCDLLGGYYAYLYIAFDYATVPEADTLTKEGRRELLDWSRELTAKTADTVFRKLYVPVDTNQSDALVLFVYQLDGQYEKSLQIFEKKLRSTVRMIMQAECSVLSTACFSGKEQLAACGRAYQQLVDDCYLEYTETRDGNGQERFEALGLTGIGASLQAELAVRNLSGAQALLERAALRVRTVDHQKSQAIWLLNELNRSASQALSEQGLSYGKEAARISSASEIDSIRTRSQVLAWIERLQKTLSDALGESSGQGSQLAERARKYVLAHLEEHVSLQDVADHVGVSVGYLSTMFKREHGQSFVEFTNQAKMTYACTLLEENRLMIAEIAYRLGYENAYYFSKVFRKYMGMTPTEYQKKHR